MSDRLAAWIREKIAEHTPEITSDSAAAIEAWRVAIQQRWICPGCAVKSKR